MASLDFGESGVPLDVGPSVVTAFFDIISIQVLELIIGNQMLESVNAHSLILGSELDGNRVARSGVGIVDVLPVVPHLSVAGSGLLGGAENDAVDRTIGGRGIAQSLVTFSTAQLRIAGTITLQRDSQDVIVVYRCPLPTQVPSLMDH